MIVTVEYMAYNNAKQRCTNPNSHQYYDYGGRGIQFLFTSFDQFLEDIGLKPSPDLTLDRKNNDGNYEPGNVRWATRIQQRKNSRGGGIAGINHDPALQRLRCIKRNKMYGTPETHEGCVKGGKASMALRTSEQQSKSGKIGGRIGGKISTHIRWHVRRKINNPNCILCAGKNNV
jgi:hypothetical protein